MKTLATTVLAASLILSAGAAFAQSAGSSSAKGTESDKTSTVKAPGADVSKGSGMQMAPAATSGSAIKSQEDASGMSKDKGGLATPSDKEKKRKKNPGRN